jgi:site-specific recombinase XerD
MKHYTDSLSPLLGDLVRGFFQWLARERNVSPGTITSYRDTMVAFIRFLADSTGQTVDILSMNDDFSDHVVDFLNHLENVRKCSISTRNHRLSTIKSFCRYAAYAEPLSASNCHRVTLIPLKKKTEPLVEYLELDEMEAIISTANPTSVEGRRDRALLLMLFNTGCRVSELVQMTTEHLQPGPPRHVRILGKGRKWRTVPLWERTIKAIEATRKDRRDDNHHLFIGQRGSPLTRFGVRHLLDRRCKAATTQMPSLNRRKVSPHTIRHTTAVALLRATGDIDAVSKVLGHASLNTTRIYTAADRSRLAETINSISSALLPAAMHEWKPDADLLVWLESL